MLAKDQEVLGHEEELQGRDTEEGKTDIYWAIENNSVCLGGRGCVGGVG